MSGLCDPRGYDLCRRAGNARGMSGECQGSVREMSGECQASGRAALTEIYTMCMIVRLSLSLSLTHIKIRGTGLELWC